MAAAGASLCAKSRSPRDTGRAMSRENVEVVRRMYAAINSGLEPNAVSDEALATVFDPEIEVRQLAALAGTAGSFHGYAGLREAKREVDEVLRDHRYELA